MAAIRLAQLSRVKQETSIDPIGVMWFYNEIAPLAQLEEQWSSKPQVAGSSPAGRTIFIDIEDCCTV